MATPAELPGFWHFMYRVSPLTYLISALISTGIANQEVHCSALELLSFSPPSGQTCGEYMSAWIAEAGGALSDPDATQSCEFCSISNTNTFLASVSSYYDQRWRNFGLMFAYIGFNVVAALGLYWLGRVPKSGGRPHFLRGLKSNVMGIRGKNNA